MTVSVEVPPGGTVMLRELNEAAGLLTPEETTVAFRFTVPEKCPTVLRPILDVPSELAKTVIVTGLDVRLNLLTSTCTEIEWLRNPPRPVQFPVTVIV